MKERIHVPAYLLKETFYQVSCFPSFCRYIPHSFSQIIFTLFLLLFVNLKQNLPNYLSLQHRNRGLARREDSITQNVSHLPEKCRADPHLFEKVYCLSCMLKLQSSLKVYSPCLKDMIFSSSFSNPACKPSSACVYLSFIIFT